MPPVRAPAAGRWLVGPVMALAALVLALFGWRAWGPLQRAPGANVLLVTIDTLRADAVGAYGQERPTTPVVDRLARAGVVFTAARAHNTVTLPSHANILSGRLPPRHGVRDNGGFRFPREMPTLATLLRDRGYRTGAFVSSATLDARFGLDRGFDVYDDALGEHSLDRVDLPERAGAVTVRRAREWLRGAGERPWLCWVHLYDPHAPYAPRSPWREAFRDAPYLGDVAAADAALAPLLGPLLDGHLQGRTLVVLTADHGEALGDHGERTHGLYAYEATLHVPLILYEPRALRPRVVEDNVGHVDLLPTVLDALGHEIPADLEGRSLLPAAQGRRLEARVGYFEALSSMLSRGWAPLRGVVDGRFKYVDLPLPELYDLEEDPEEKRNLLDAAPGRVAALRERLAELRGDERPLESRREDAELRQRLAALGYLATTAPPAADDYGPDDDPKRLVHLDATMQEALDLRRRGELGAARSLARRVVEERPDMTAALLQLALIERELGDQAAALATLEAAVASNPADPTPVVLLADLLGATGQADRGLAVLAPWVERDDAPADVLTTRGKLLARLGRNDEALASLQRARAQEASGTTLVTMATVHLAAGDREAARTRLEAALEEDPALAAAQRLLGVLSLDAGDAAEAERRFVAALQLDPAEADALLNLGRLLRAQGRLAEARPVLQRFLDVAPPQIYAAQADAVRRWLGEAD